MRALIEVPFKKVLSAAHVMADLTLPYGQVIFDYLERRFLTFYNLLNY